MLEGASAQHRRSQNLQVSRCQWDPQNDGNADRVSFEEYYQYSQILLILHAYRYHLPFSLYHVVHGVAYKSLKMNDENCSVINRTPRRPGCQLIHSLNACITTLTPFFLRNRLEDKFSLPIQNFGEIFLRCVQRLANVVACEANQLQITGQMPLIPLLRSAKWFQMTL